MRITVSTAGIQGVYKHSQVTDELSSSTENIQNSIGDANRGRILTGKANTSWKGEKGEKEKKEKKEMKEQK